MLILQLMKYLTEKFCVLESFRLNERKSYSPFTGVNASPSLNTSLFSARTTGFKKTNTEHTTSVNITRDATRLLDIVPPDVVCHVVEISQCKKWIAACPIAYGNEKHRLRYQDYQDHFQKQFQTVNNTIHVSLPGDLYNSC